MPRPWSVDDAPSEYIDGLLEAIVGVTIEVVRIEAKRKLSQNKPDADVDGRSGRSAVGRHARRRRGRRRDATSGIGDVMEHGIEPIGYVTAGRTDRRDDGWDREFATITLSDRFTPDSLLGLDEFSHVEVVFRFHGLSDADVTTDARHPRGNPEWPRVGIFAQRGSKRPNRLAVTICHLVSVDGLEVRVRGLDAIDGTPVLDIKPVMQEFLPRGDVVEPHWVGELMAGYWDGPDVADDDG